MRTALTHALTYGKARYATVAELGELAGMSVDDVITELGDMFDARQIALEAADGDVFLLTAPTGRTPETTISPSLWELLRTGRSVSQAAKHYRATRQLERSGWKVIPDPSAQDQRVARVLPVAVIGLNVQGFVCPVALDPDLPLLVYNDGLLASYDRAGIEVVAVTCPLSKLDEYVTAVRRWHLSRITPSRIAVLVLEAPRYQPVPVSATDTSVTPISIDHIRIG
jgi:hypothetical protein